MAIELATHHFGSPVPLVKIIASPMDSDETPASSHEVEYRLSLTFIGELQFRSTVEQDCMILLKVLLIKYFVLIFEIHRERLRLAGHLLQGKIRVRDRRVDKTFATVEHQYATDTF